MKTFDLAGKITLKQVTNIINTWDDGDIYKIEFLSLVATGACEIMAMAKILNEKAGINEAA